VLDFSCRTEPADMEPRNRSGMDPVGMLLVVLLAIGFAWLTWQVVTYAMR
jgi:hypothetical protein